MPILTQTVNFPTLLSGHPRKRILSVFFLSIGLILILIATYESMFSMTRMQVAPADDLVNMLGVTLHLGFRDTVYFSGFNSIVKPKLKSLGIRHARDALTSDPSTIERIIEVNSLGIDFLFVVDPTDWSTPAAALGAAHILAPYTSAWEGGNELDVKKEPVYDGQKFPAGAVSWQADLWHSFKTDAIAETKPIILGAMAFTANFSKFCGMTTCPSSFADFGNIHSYSGASYPADSLDLNIYRAEEASGKRPIFATESGWHTDGTIVPGFNGISEAAQGKYISTSPFEYFNRNIKGSFIYELIDHSPDSTKEDSENHFGLLRNDGTAKVAFTTLKNIISLLSDPGEPYTGKTVSLSIGGSVTCQTNCEGVHYSLFDKRDGRLYIALWREVIVFDTKTQRDVNIKPIPIRVSLNDHWSAANIYEPYISNTSLASVLNPKSVSVNVGPDTLIVELMP